MSETTTKDNTEDGQDGGAPKGMRGPSLPGMRVPGEVSSAMPRPEPSGAMAARPGLGAGHQLPPRPGERLDEDAERFLIQKEDKMDYGPFSLRDIKAQIEQGKVHAEHTIIDNETGDRRRVADSPHVGQMAREWTAKHAELERQLKDQKEQAKYRDSVVKLLSYIAAGMAVVAALVLVYVKFIYKAPQTQVAKPEMSNAEFFKDIQIAMKVEPPPPKKPRKKSSKNGAFDDSQSINFDEGGDVLSQEDIQKVMSKNFSMLSGCLREAATGANAVKKFEVEFIVKGTGKVSSVRVNGSTGSPVAGCIHSKMQAVDFPECKTCSKTVASMSFAIK